MRKLAIGTVVLGSWAWLFGAGPSGSSAQSEAITFSNQIVRIFQNHCQVCHHPGDIAPFSLMTYEDTAPWAEAIAAKTASREMPPWKAAAGCNEFNNARSLSQTEIDTIGAWVAAGAPEGNPSDLPEPLQFSTDWQLGEPDAHFVTTAKGYVLPASATEDIYRCFTVPTNFDADRFISAIEIRPGNRQVVHHVLLFTDGTGASEALDRADPGPGYTMFGGVGFTPTGFLGGWAPGGQPSVLPPGMGYRVPKGSRIVIQVHYKPDGTEQEDITEIGLHFARSPVHKDFFVLPVLNNTFTIPAGDPHYAVTAGITLPSYANLTLYAIAPHMHLLGKEMYVTARFPDGSSTCLIDLQNWDFHWQGTYGYKQPIRLPGGTRVDVTAYYDNSAANPHQPANPPVDVSWGEKTTDEMCIAFLGITVDAEYRETSNPSIQAVRVAGSKLIVKGADIRAGALIDINGQLCMDTKRKEGRASSKRHWMELAPVGVPVSVRILNADGAMSSGVTFTR